MKVNYKQKGWLHWLREVGGVGKKIGTSEGGKGGGGRAMVHVSSPPV